MRHFKIDLIVFNFFFLELLHPFVFFTARFTTMSMMMMMSSSCCCCCCRCRCPLELEFGDSLAEAVVRGIESEEATEAQMVPRTAVAVEEEESR